ncbi:hypothetical protein Tco_1142253 [Tanacetum coccineum]
MRNTVNSDRYGIHKGLVQTNFSGNQMFSDETFEQMFQMSRRLFTKILSMVDKKLSYVKESDDDAESEGSDDGLDFFDVLLG